MSIVDYHGVSLSVIDGNIRFISATYEPEEISIALNSIPTNARVVCGGGGLGLVASALACRVGVDNLLVIEPNPVLVYFMNQNVRVNGRSLNVVEGAMGVGYYVFHENPDNWAGGAITLGTPGDKPCLPLNQLLVDGYDTLFLDIEGAELWLLKSPLIKGFARIMVEYHHPEHLIDNLMLANGFAVTVYIRRYDNKLERVYKLWEQTNDTPI